MDPITVFLNELLSFLVQLLALFVHFWIAVLQLILHFVQTIAGQR